MNRQPAEVFPPCVFIQEELEARELTVDGLAKLMGSELSLVQDVVAGKTSLTPEIAKDLGRALGIDSQFWINIQEAFFRSLRHELEE